MKIISEEGVDVCVNSSIRLFEDAFTVSSVTRTALLELALEELFKAWWAYYALHPSEVPMELKNRNFSDELQNRYRKHPFKIESMQLDMKIMKATLTSVGINRKLILEEAGTSDQSKIAKALELEDESKLKKLVEIVIEAIASKKVEEVQDLKEDSLYTDIENGNLIEPHEPRDYDSVAGIAVYCLMSYKVLKGWKSFPTRLMEKVRKDRRVNEFRERARISSGIAI